MPIQQVPGNRPDSEPEFQSGFPNCQNMDEFQIKLAKIGDMRKTEVIRAALDTSRRYSAEGPKWTALETGANFSKGQRIPSHRVEGWRRLDSE